MLRNIWKYLQKRIAYFKRVKYSLMNNFKKKKNSKTRKNAKNDTPGKLPMVMIVVGGLLALFYF